MRTIRYGRLIVSCKREKSNWSARRIRELLLRQDGRHERIWHVTFVQNDLRFFDDKTCRLETAENPFQARVLPMS